MSPNMFRLIKNALAPSAFEPELPPHYLGGIRKLSFTSSTDASIPDFDPLLVSAFDLSDMLNNQIVTSVEIVEAYLAQIEQHNRRGRQLRALISVAPRHELLKIARRLDDERARGKLRGPLHGIPVVVKDNIMTDVSLGMDTTVGELSCVALHSQHTATDGLTGSYAFVGCIPKKNAAVVDRLIKRGMIILGKSNLTEFCGLKNPSMPPGWSAVGGQCQSPYVARHIAKKKKTCYRTRNRRARGNNPRFQDFNSS